MVHEKFLNFCCERTFHVPELISPKCLDCILKQTYIILRNLVCIDNVFCYAPVKPVIFQYSSISVIVTNESELCPGCLCNTYNVLDVLLFWREIKELYFIYDDESDMIEFDPFLYKPFCCRDTLGPNGPSSMVISGIQKSVKCCGNGFKHVSDIFSERCHHDDGDLYIAAVLKLMIDYIRIHATR